MWSAAENGVRHMKALAVIAGFLLFLIPSLGSGKQRRGLDLVLYYPFDEIKGRTTKDLSRFRNDGEVHGKGTWRKGKFGHALYFCREVACGAAPGLVQTPEHEIFAFEAGEEITLMAWINVDPANLGEKLMGARAIIYNRPRDTHANYGLRMDRVDPSFFYRDNEDVDFHRATGIWDAIPLDKWLHIAATSTFGNPEAMKIYLDGKLQRTNMKGGTKPDDWSLGDGTKPPMVTKGPVTIGGYGKFLDSFQGFIDEVMIWKGTFTEEELQEIMLAPGSEFLSVEPHAELATIWGTLKQSS